MMPYLENGKDLREILGKLLKTPDLYIQFCFILFICKVIV